MIDLPQTKPSITTIRPPRQWPDPPVRNESATDGSYSFQLQLNFAQAKGIDRLLNSGLYGTSSHAVVTRIIDRFLIDMICSGDLESIEKK